MLGFFLVLGARGLGGTYGISCFRIDRASSFSFLGTGNDNFVIGGIV